ncbi:MAG: hypothetical protein LIP11_12075 [Clostridiales bacterium]|nr:hypothetical protein [Clostridiales bacterium]
MSITERLKERLKKTASYNRASMEEEAWHSKSYHKYFEGYAEQKKTMPNGKQKIVRVYVGDYHSQNLTRKQGVCLRILYAAFFALSVLCFFLAAKNRTEGNFFWLSAISHAAAGGLYLWVFYGLVNYLMTGRDMTINDYRTSSLVLMKATVAEAAALASSGLVALLWFLICDHTLSGLLNAVLFFLAGGCVLAVRFLEQKVEYTVKKNDGKAEYGDVVID